MMKPILVESTEPLEELQRKDYEAYALSEINYPLLSEAPDGNRVDYFDIAYGTDEFHSSINYRLTKPNSRVQAERNVHPAQIDDCARALKWIADNIERYGGGPDNIAIAGHSAGGHLTALLVCDIRWHEKYNIDISKIKCWVCLSGIHDLTLEENYYHEWMRAFIGALIDEEYKLMDASPVSFVKGSEPPCLLVHGTNDYLVPITNSLNLYNKLSEQGVKAEICIVKNAAHMDYFSRLNEENQIAARTINQFLARYL